MPTTIFKVMSALRGHALGMHPHQIIHSYAACSVIAVECSVSVAFNTDIPLNIGLAVHGKSRMKSKEKRMSYMAQMKSLFKRTNVPRSSILDIKDPHTSFATSSNLAPLVLPGVMLNVIIDRRWIVQTIVALLMALPRAIPRIIIPSSPDACNSVCDC